MNNRDINILKESAVEAGYDYGFLCRQIDVIKSFSELEDNKQLKIFSEDAEKYLIDNIRSYGSIGALDEESLFQEFAYGGGQENRSRNIFNNIVCYKNRWMEYQVMDWHMDPIKRSTFYESQDDVDTKNESHENLLCALLRRLVNPKRR
jgi:hypothetical protein